MQITDYFFTEIQAAEYLGVSYRHLLYTFKLFLDDGILTKVKKGYGIKEDELRILAKDIEIT